VPSWENGRNVTTYSRWPAVSVAQPGHFILVSSRQSECYDIFVERLVKRFGNARQQSKWLSRLEARKRVPGESISALGDDLRQMAQRAYPELDLRAQEVLAINQLYKTVTLEVKCRCMDKECHTISEAVDVIERYESIRPNTKMCVFTVSCQKAARVGR
jgi:hypothetical protein